MVGGCVVGKLPGRGTVAPGRGVVAPGSGVPVLGSGVENVGGVVRLGRTSAPLGVAGKMFEGNRDGGGGIRGVAAGTLPGGSGVIIVGAVVEGMVVIGAGTIGTTGITGAPVPQPL